MSGRGGPGRRGDAPYHDFSRIVGMDPAANFLLGPGWDAFRGGEIDPVLNFVVTPSPELVHSLADDARGFRLLGAGRESAHPDDLVTALTTRDFLIGQLEGGKSFADAPKSLQLCLPMPQRLVSPVPDDKLAKPPVYQQRHWRGAALVAIIDDGIALGHERFRRADGSSRFEYFWDQDGDIRPPDEQSVPFGREFGKAEIDQLLTAHTVPGLGVDETGFYRAIGLADFRRQGHKAVALRLAHGTHVLDLASGFASRCDVGSRPLIGVQLQVSATARMSGAGLEAPVVAALRYIRKRAALLSPDLPVVINFSYGTYLGPHNGRAKLERKMRHLIETSAAPIRIVLPAGNSNMVRAHEVVMPADEAAMAFRVQPDSKDPAAVQIWLPIAIGTGPGLRRVAIKVTAPDGGASGWIEEDAGQDVLLPSGTPFAAAAVPNYGRVSFHMGRHHKQGHFRIDIQPTAWDLPGGPTDALVRRAPAGVWRVLVRNQALPAGTVLQAWIERSDLLYGYPRRGRQAYFVSPLDVRVDAQGRPIVDDLPGADPVRRTGMESAIVTGRGPMVLGGYSGKDSTIADYSAGGPSLAAGPMMARPDALAVTDDSRVHMGVRGAGSRSGSVLTMRGTSVAAPQVTRLVAKWLAKGKVADRAALITRAKADEGTLGLPHPPANRGGQGRLRLKPVYRHPKRVWTSIDQS